jgi:hypothetical protein
MTELFKIPLTDGSEAIAAHVQAMADLPLVMAQIGLQPSQPTIALVGGANQMTTCDDDRLKQFFTTVIGQTAVKMGAAIVDGGTNAGIMQLIGQVHGALNANFSLVGVAPFAKMSLPHLCYLPPASALPAPHHTHFILVPGDQWGDESAWLAKVTTLLSGHSPSVTIVVNGGDVTWNDVIESVAAQRLTLVLAGSGRTADRLAMAVQGESDDATANRLVATGLLKLIRLESDLSQLAQELVKILTCPG